MLVQVEPVVDADPVRVRLRNSGRPCDATTRSVALALSHADDHGGARAYPQRAENVDVLDGRVCQAPVDHLRQLAAWRRAPSTKTTEKPGSARTAPTASVHGPQTAPWMVRVSATMRANCISEAPFESWW